MAKLTELVINSANANDLSFSSSDSAQRTLANVGNHLSGGLNGSRTVRSVQVRDSVVAASASITLDTFAAGTVLLINGAPFTAIGSGTAVVANDEFLISGTNAADATALYNAINNSTTAGIAGVVVATNPSSGVVTVTAAQPGLSGNGITIENLGVVATATITCAAVDEDDAIAINGVTITAKDEPADDDIEFAVLGTNALTAAALGAVINGTDEAMVNQYVRALVRSNVVHLFAKHGGTIGNANTLTTTDGTDLALAVTNGRFAGGTVTQHEGVQASGTVTLASATNGQTVTVNGVVFTAHTDTEAANQFSIAGSDTEDAASLVKAINNSTTAAAREVFATSTDDVVTITARRGGPIGNIITLASSDGTTLAVTGARLENGAVPTVAVVAGGVGTQTGGGARLASGSSGTAINYTI